MPLSELAPLAKRMGYDGLELACWGDHFEVDKALASSSYVDAKRALLNEHGLECYALSAHLVGQCVCDAIDSRHEAILPSDVWGDGDAEGVRKRAAKRMMDTARAARAFGVGVVNGFTGSSIWHAAYAFPPTSQEYWDAGFEDFAERWLPILDAFDEAGVGFALEVHPTEIAFDIATALRAINAVRGHPRFGFNYDPSHLAYQGVDYVKFVRFFGEAGRIKHVHLKDVWFSDGGRRRGDGTVGVFGGHTSFGDARRAWDFRSLGRGDVDFEAIVVALNDIGYRGPLSVEWEDARMERVAGATEACAYARRLDFAPSAVAFDAAFARKS
jgi:sugar phosphate isomerase/epimerase